MSNYYYQGTAADRVREAFRQGYRVTEMGQVISPHSGKPLKAQLNSGYYRFNLNTPGFRGMVTVHRLAAFQWFGEALFKAGIQVRHLNGNAKDNSRDNIAIGTATENHRDKAPGVHQAVSAAGGRARRALSDAQLMEFRRDRANGATYKQLRAKYGLAKSTVSYIVNGRFYQALRDHAG